MPHNPDRYDEKGRIFLDQIWNVGQFNGRTRPDPYLERSDPMYDR